MRLFFFTEKFKIREFFIDGLYKCLENANNNEFIKSLSLNHGFSKILESTPRDVLNQRCYDYCEACRIIGNVFNKKGKY